MAPCNRTQESHGQARNCMLWIGDTGRDHWQRSLRCHAPIEICVRASMYIRVCAAQSDSSCAVRQAWEGAPEAEGVVFEQVHHAHKASRQHQRQEQGCGEHGHRPPRNKSSKVAQHRVYGTVYGAQAPTIRGPEALLAPCGA